MLKSPLVLLQELELWAQKIQKIEPAIVSGSYQILSIAKTDNSETSYTEAPLQLLS